MARRKASPRKIGARARKKTEALVPASVRSHLKASVREALLAFESIFDEAVKALEKEGKQTSSKRGRKIKVE